MKYLRLTWAIFSFTVCMILKLVTVDLLGLFLVPLGILFGSKKISAVTHTEMFNPPRWLWLWGNDEEGYDAPKSYTLWGPIGDFERRYRWAALRNRTDNLQFTWFCPPPVEGHIDHMMLGNRGGFICWQGWRHYVWARIGSHAISFGWNYYPLDNAGLAAFDVRRHGCGFGGRWTP